MNINLRTIASLLKIYNEIRLTGGVSYNVNTGDFNPKFGYMVALANHEEVVTSIDEDVIADYIKRHATEFAKDNAFFGCWFDGTNYVLDVSEHYEHKRDAVFWAIVRKQKAIWDCAKRDEIRVKVNHGHALRKGIEAL